MPRAYEIIRIEESSYRQTHEFALLHVDCFCKTSHPSQYINSKEAVEMVKAWAFVRYGQEGVISSDPLRHINSSWISFILTFSRGDVAERVVFELDCKWID